MGLFTCTSPSEQLGSGQRLCVPCTQGHWKQVDRWWDESGLLTHNWAFLMLLLTTASALPHVDYCPFFPWNGSPFLAPKIGETFWAQLLVWVDTGARKDIYSFLSEDRSCHPAEVTSCQSGCCLATTWAGMVKFQMSPCKLQFQTQIKAWNARP